VIDGTKKVLNERFAGILKRVNKIDKNSSKYSVKSSNSGPITLFLKDDTTEYYVHSKYDPVGEAIRTIESHKEISDYNHVLFIGIGLGYHIEAFCEKYPEKDFSVILISHEIGHYAFNRIDLSERKYSNLKQLYIANTEFEFAQISSFIIDMMRERTYIVNLPSYNRLFKDEVTYINNKIRDLALNRRFNLKVNTAYEKRWIVNSISNFKHTLNTQNAIHSYKEKLANKPVIIVGAGPSIEYDIENLREIKESGSAYLFAVGSGMNILLNNGIIPDAVCTYDPSTLNIKVFEKVIEQNKFDMPLIFGTSVSNDVLASHKGAKIHLITEQDNLSRYYFKHENNEKVDFVHDAPSISVVILEMLLKIGASPIIFAGLNCAYLHDSWYPESLDYSHLKDVLAKQSVSMTKDVEGNEIKTTRTLMKIKSGLELHLGKPHNSVVYNATQGGAVINGSTYKKMDELRWTVLTKKIVENQWFDKKKKQYDTDFFERQNKKIYKDYKGVGKNFEKIAETLKGIDIAERNRNVKQIESKFKKMDILIKELENNLFYKTVVLPMNRTLRSLLTKDSLEIRNEKDIFVKGRKIVESYSNYIYLCNNDLATFNPLFELFFQWVSEEIDRNSNDDKRTTLCLIPARAGSKGLPDKNFKNLNGKPTIAYTIEAALNSKEIDHILVTTDCEEIIKIVKSYGVDAPFVRPVELSTDNSLLNDVVDHALEYMESNEKVFDDVILLQPTSPLRSSTDIDEALKLYHENDCESVISVYEADVSVNITRLVDENGFLRPVSKNLELNVNRQDAVKMFVLNGAIYITSIKVFGKYKSFHTQKILPYIMPKERSIDIDNLDDFEKAEMILKS